MPATLFAGPSTVQMREATGPAIAGTAEQLITMMNDTADFNSFLDADHSKLDGIELLADVTDYVNVAAALAAPSANLVFNEAGGDFDVRFEGLSNSHLLMLDGGANIVGISNSGLAPTDGLVHLQIATAGVVEAVAGSILVLESNDDTVISMLVPHDKDAGLVVGSPTGNSLGSLIYKLTEAEWVFNANGIEVLTLGGDNVFNETGVDINWRMETTGNASKFFLEGGNDLVQVAMGQAPSALANVGGLLSAEIGSTGTAADTAEHDLMTYTLPADSFNTLGDYLKISFIVTFAANVAIKTYRVYFGSLVFLIHSTTTPADDAGGSLWGKVTVIRSAVDTQLLYTEALGISTLPSGGAPGTFVGGTEDDGADIIIKVTGQSAGGTLNDVSCLKLQVEMGEA